MGTSPSRCSGPQSPSTLEHVVRSEPNKLLTSARGEVCCSRNPGWIESIDFLMS